MEGMVEAVNPLHKASIMAGIMEVVYIMEGEAEVEAETTEGEAEAEAETMEEEAETMEEEAEMVEGEVVMVEGVELAPWMLVMNEGVRRHNCVPSWI